EKLATEKHHSEPWLHGTSILFRGEPVTLQVISHGKDHSVQFSDQSLQVTSAVEDLRAPVERQLWSLAKKELTERTLQLAAQHDPTVTRVLVRTQRSRWGSCSVRKTISLNWRLIQAPPSVRDYLILHELMHLHEMNHSRRFWNLVETACPGYAQAESWLNQHA